MIVICKDYGDGACPMDLNICCRECSMRNNCQNVCDVRGDGCEHRQETPGDASGFALAIPSTIKRLEELTRLKKQIEDEEKQLRQKVQIEMGVYGLPKWENERISFTAVAPSSRTGVDSALLKKKYPKVYAECIKTTAVAGSLKVVLKDG